MNRFRIDALAVCATCVLAVACGKGGEGEGKTAAGGEPQQQGNVIAVQKAADMLHAVMEADRTTYTRQVVNRLTKEEKVTVVNPETKESEPFAASEQWKSEHGKLPLPAQMFRMGAEEVNNKPDAGFSYVLLSKWPINKQNRAKTDVETQGLDALAADGSKPFYGEENLGGKKYFVAVYADTAVAPACVDCHNDHKDSPKNDFKLGDVMGGVVIRIPL